MYAELLKSAILAIIFRATKIFMWRTTIAYLSISAILALIKPNTFAPEQLLLYTFGIFAAYVIYGIIKHRVWCATNKKSVSAVPRRALTVSFGTLTAMYAIVYFFRILGANEYISFFAMLAIFFILGTTSNKKRDVLGFVGVLIAMVHSIIFFGGKNFLSPIYSLAAYIIILRFLIEARDAFSTAYLPKYLKEGMIPAETIIWDGKRYSFGMDPFPSSFGILRYVAGNEFKKRRIVTSFFKPLNKETISELQKVSKTNKKNIFLIQKKIDFLPFLIIGAIAAYALS